MGKTQKQQSCCFLADSSLPKRETAVMGCLLSCCGGDSDSEAGDAGERTRLLPESDRSNACHGVPDGLHSEHNSALAGPYSHSLPKATDEQSALSRILHETAGKLLTSVPWSTHLDWSSKSTLKGVLITVKGWQL